MKNGTIIIIFIALIVSAITLRTDNIYLNIVGLCLFLASVIAIFIFLSDKKKKKN